MELATAFFHIFQDLWKDVKKKKHISRLVKKKKKILSLVPLLASFFLAPSLIFHCFITLHSILSTLLLSPLEIIFRLQINFSYSALTIPKFTFSVHSSLHFFLSLFCLASLPLSIIQ